MRWRGRRESSNVEDRRGRGVSMAGGLGGGGLVIALIYFFVMGDPSLIFNEILNGGGGSPRQTQQTAAPSPAQDDAARFVRVVLADSEDVWTEVFAQQGKTYKPPRLVLFTDSVRSACGMASKAVGPFYCPADQNIYLDLGFFEDLSRKLGASGDFAQAYVIAHEVGHHVQTLLRLDAGSQERLTRNQASVAVELQADCFAGIWAQATEQMHQSLEEGDIEEALSAAAAVGDDKLQQAARGYVVPDSFTHGSSAQRVSFFQRGFRAAKLSDCTPSRGHAVSQRF